MKSQYFRSLFAYFSVLICITCGNETNTKICSQCPHSPKVDSYLVKFCEKENITGTLHQNASCCINTTATPEDSQIIGLDMSGCKLKNIHGMFRSEQNLRVIILENNTELKTKQEDFLGLSKLVYLSLPNTLQCPGGNKSWDSIENQPSSTICHGEINLCCQNNVTCQNSNSHCVLAGPGQMECLCLPGYYGYKCLRQGKFPSVIYTIILCLGTVSVSGFLWCTQRRKVKKAHPQ